MEGIEKGNLKIGEIIPKITIEQKKGIIDMLSKDNNLFKVRKYLGISRAAVKIKMNKLISNNYDPDFKEALIEGNMKYKEGTLDDLLAAASEEKKKYEFYKLKAEKINAWSVCNNALNFSDDIIDYDSDNPYETINDVIRGIANKKIDRQDALAIVQLIKDSYAVKEVETTEF